MAQLVAASKKIRQPCRRRLRRGSVSKVEHDWQVWAQHWKGLGFLVCRWLLSLNNLCRALRRKGQLCTARTCFAATQRLCP